MTEPCEEIDEKTGKTIEVPCPTPEEEKKREKLPAETKFDKWVYGGISYFAQAFTGMMLSYWLAYKGGRKYFDRIGEAAAPLMSKITGKTGQAAIEESRSKIIVTTMIMVGNSFLIPVKWLENRKPQIVRWLTAKNNGKREAKGETITAEEHAHQEKLLTQLEHAPRQSWWSLGWGRAFSLGAVYAVNFGIQEKNNQALENLFAKGVSKTLNTAGLKQLGHSENVQNFSRIAFNDFFYSIVSAGGLYVWSHLLCPPKKNTPSASSETALAAASPVAVHGSEAEVQQPPKNWADKPALRPAERLAPPAASFREGVQQAPQGAESSISA